PGGFLGRYIAEQLLARGDTVRGFARGDYPELRDAGVEMIRGDLADRDAVVRACDEIDCVFHVAGKVGVWGHWFEYFQANVQGTLNVLGACQEAGVRRLVFTSSPSVTFDAADPERAHQRGIDETPRFPRHKYALHGKRREAIDGGLSEYPERWLAHYPHSKAVAEQLVLAENGHRGLRTCSLRPHLVWGPRDTNLTARLIERARAGKLRRVGDGANRVDMVYVENAADAHLQAADALADRDSPVAGRAYYLSQGEPVNCWRWIDELLALAGLPPVDKSISATAAYRIGWLLESAHWWTRQWKREPRMTRFVARSLSTDHWFDIAAARRDFGYQPRVSTEEGMQQLGAWLNGSAEYGVRSAE
ncbi:MAG: NAD-dependent epimerase/dehydratase family protein, partial [Planctomycetota bacterium]